MGVDSRFRFLWFVIVWLPRITNKKTMLNVTLRNNHEPNDEHRLFLHLMRGYDKATRPVVNSSAIVSVKLGLTLTHIFKIDEKNQVLSVNIWLEQEWTDDRFRWKPEEFGDLTELTIPSRFVWTPDIVLYNNAEDYTEIMQTNTALYVDGTVLWMPPVQLKSMCMLDVTYFPFDDQFCKLRFGSWIFDGRQVDVTNRSDRITLDENSSYIDNGEWRIIDTSVEQHVRFHDCCPQIPFPEVVFTIHLRRRVLFYAYNIVVPCAMLSVITLGQFWLPCDSGERITLGLTVVLAFSVFSLNIGESMPGTSDVIPLVAIYIMCTMGVSGASVALSVLILNLHHAAARGKPVPKWLNILGKRILAPMVCWKSSGKKRQPLAKNFSFQSVFERLAECSLAQQCCKKFPQSSSEQATPEVADTITSEPRHSSNSAQEDQTVDSIVVAELLTRAGYLLDKTEVEIPREMSSDWQELAQIFDRCFFAIVVLMTFGITFSLLLFAPALCSNRGFDLS